MMLLLFRFHWRRLSVLAFAFSFSFLVILRVSRNTRALNSQQYFLQRYWQGFSHLSSSGDDSQHGQLDTASLSSFEIDEDLTWGDDPTAPTAVDNWINVRSDHPRLFASKYHWDRLSKLLAHDAYLTSWNETIFERALQFYELPPANYAVDGGFTGNGVLDVARTVQLRIKHWAYAYRLSHDMKWVDRTWEELVVASGNSSQYFGIDGDNWNSQHWLDTGEFLTSFAFAYDWLYDAWNSSQRNAIMWTMISLGLRKAIDAYDEDAWFLSVNGNWNCVTNGGIITASLAIYHEDPTGIAAKLLELAIVNVQKYCAQAVLSDGSWSETPDYWYFGTQSHAQITSALLTATGTSQKILTASPAWNYTGLYHIYASGVTEKFNFGDCGPQKITATGNSLLLYGDQFKIPRYILFQRDRPDAPDPLSMFWYNPKVIGNWFVDLPLDHNFPESSGAWVSMRSSWTDPDGLYVAMKGGKTLGHQTHSNIDAGDFVLDAQGERWAGELCHNDYLSPRYFSSEAQDSGRWLYYRCRTEGQNTILYNNSNQMVDAIPDIKFETTGDFQNSDKYTIHRAGSAYWIADLTEAYGGTLVQRGLKILGQRRQVLVQDEIKNATENSQWRMHTQASITLTSGNRVANLTLNGKSMIVTLQSLPAASFSIVEPVRLTTDPLLPEGGNDDPNVGVNVLAIDIPAGTQTVAVLFSPQWNIDQTFYPSAVVQLKDWTLSSH